MVEISENCTMRPLKKAFVTCFGSNFFFGIERYITGGLKSKSRYSPLAAILCKKPSKFLTKVLITHEILQIETKKITGREVLL